MNVRRILGIDPGLRITGFGLIVCVGGKLTYVTSGCIRSDADGSLPSRIGMILRDLHRHIMKCLLIRSCARRPSAGRRPPLRSKFPIIGDRGRPLSFTRLQ